MAATWHLGVAERKASGLGSGQNFGGVFKKSCSSMNGACHKVMLGLTVDSANIQESWTFLCPKVCCWARRILSLGESLKHQCVYLLRIASSLTIHFPSLDGHM